MSRRRAFWTLTLIIFSVISAHAQAPVANPQPAQTEEINVAQHFYLYGGAGSEFWDALLTPGNNRVLSACLKGATLQELEAVDPSYARRRVGRLKNAGVASLMFEGCKRQGQCRHGNTHAAANTASGRLGDYVG